MAERDSLFVPGSVLDVEEARVGIGAMWTPSTNAVKAKTGMRPGPNSPGAVTATGTPDANVHVAPFQAILQDVRGTTGGVYIITLDSVKDINILSTPAHASLARNDLVIAHQPDTFYGDDNSTMVVRQVVGTPSGSPADPSLASFPNNITLARVRVDAAATTIVSGKITDLRPAAVVAVGGLLPVATQALRNALTGMYDGMGIYRTDRDWIEAYDGSAWRVQGVAKVSSFADLSAVTDPYAGLLATSGDGTMYRYDGSGWRYDPYKAIQTVSVAAATVTFSSIPSTLRKLELRWRAKTSDTTAPRYLLMRINGSSSAVYYDHITNMIALAAPALGQDIGQTRGNLGLLMANDVAAGVNFSGGTANIMGWPSTGTDTALHWEANGGGMHGSAGFRSLTAGTVALGGPYTSISLFSGAGNIMAGSEFTLWGWD